MKKVLIKQTLILFFFSLVFLISACGGSSSDIRYVAIGASDATGIGATPLTNGYVYRIEDGLQASTGKDVGLTNLGIPGATADVIEETERPVAKEINPELITIFMGGNDITRGVSVEGFTNSFRNVVGDMVNDTDAFVVVANLPDMTQLPDYRDNPDANVTPERLFAYNQAIANVANEFGVPVVDLASEPIEDYLISSDGFHPNDAGYEKMANKFLEVIIPFFANQAEGQSN